MDGEQRHFSNAAKRALWKGAARRLVGPVLGLVFLCFAQVAVLAGQQPFDPVPQRLESPGNGLNGLDSVLAKRQLMLLNVQRQRKLVSDTDKLLKLAAELKSEIDAGGNSGSLSPQQVHKAEEIEKLAKSVKQKMVLSVGEGPSIADIFP